MGTAPADEPAQPASARQADVAWSRERLLAAELADCREALERAERAAAELAPALEALASESARADAAQARAVTAEQSLEGISRSASWRLTTPLRRLAAARRRSVRS